MRVPHVTLDLGFRYEGSHRIDDDDIHGTRAHQDLADLEALLPCIRLRDQERLDVHAQFAGVLGVESMFGVNEGGDTAVALRVGDDVQAERGLAARLRPVNLGHAPTRNSPHADRRVEVDRAG